VLIGYGKKLFPILLIIMFSFSGIFGFAFGSDQPRHTAFSEREAERREMVREQMREVDDERVLAAMSAVPRHRFMPREMQPYAYTDEALPIGFEQTISQPYIVAYMTQFLDVKSSHRVLELGTGSGYQAAILGELAQEVYSVEIVPELATRADSMLRELSYQNVHVKQGDGFLGWPEHAPFDRIIITFAVKEAPQPVVEQLANNGLLIMPMHSADGYQRITTVYKDKDGKLSSKQSKAVIFVPMTGEHAR
jgi:protein-L-isoaspartate(D-aspartate) O-methyltransferase